MERMSVAKKIFNGWKNFLIQDPVVEEIASKRASICSKCDGAKEGKFLAILKDYNQKQIEGFYCDHCPTNIKCPLSAKVRSENEECPKEKW